MTKLIRWGGLLGFVIVVGVLFCVSHFFIDSWIKYGIEKSVSKAVGAEVNVATVKHHYSPLGITLSDIQITDSDRPSYNTVQLASVSASLEFAPLLMNKFIINDLSAKGVQFGSERASPGDVYTTTASESAQVDKAKIKLPSVDDVLAQSPLKITQAAQSIDTHYQQHSQSLKTHYESLPSQEELADYQGRIKALSEKKYTSPDELIAAQKSLRQLKTELREKHRSVTSFKQSVAEARKQIDSDIEQLQAASKKDFQLLKGLVAGDAAAFGEITEALFGEKAKTWASYLFAAFDLVVPVLQSQRSDLEDRVRAEGRWVEFTDKQPLPHFLVRNAEVSLLWEGQSFASRWQDITAEHDILGRPTTYSVHASESKQWKSLLVEGNFSFSDAAINAAQAWKLVDIAVSDVVLGNTDTAFISGKLKQTKLSSNGSLKIDKGVLDGNGLLNFSELIMDMGSSNETMSKVVNAVNGLSSLSMKVGLDGVLSDPHFSLGSDLDKQLKTILGDQVSNEAKVKLDELQSKLNAKVAKKSTSTDNNLSAWLQWETLANSKSAAIEDMLNAEIKSALDKQKNLLENTLKKRIR